jgi:DNA repair protein RadD
LKLRYYQQEALSCLWDYINTKPGNPVIVLPTGAGKTPVIAAICQQMRDWDYRVMVATHVKELVEQNVDKLSKFIPAKDIGVYSASCGSKQVNKPVIVAGVHSAYKEHVDFGKVNMLIIDECHLVKGFEEGMYGQLFSKLLDANRSMRIVGLTATPYRMASGLIYGHTTGFTDCCYEIDVATLIEQGYLSKLITKKGVECDTSGLKMTQGDFDESQAEELVMSLVDMSVSKILDRTQDRSSILLFCQTIRHANEVARLVEGSGYNCPIITGETDKHIRAWTIKQFREKQVRFIANVNVLSTGFDAPNVDCVCLLRPTASPGLYYQMVGRGLRTSPGKENCLVLDFGNNVRRHGPVDQVRVKTRGKAGKSEVREGSSKECPECEAYVPSVTRECPYCGYAWPVNHEPEPDEIAIVGTEFFTKPVVDVLYRVHEKKNADPSHPKTMRVTYKFNMWEEANEWICIEHEGFAKRKAERWWRERSNDPFPESAQQAVDIANAGGLSEPLEVTYTLKDRWPEVKSVKTGPKPEGVSRDGEDIDFEEIARQQAAEDSREKLTDEFMDFIDQSFSDDDAPF